MLTNEDMMRLELMISNQFDHKFEEKFKAQNVEIDRKFDQRFKEQEDRIDRRFVKQDEYIVKRFQDYEKRMTELIDHRFHQQQLYLENEFGSAFQALKEYLPPTGKTYRQLEARVDSIETKELDAFTVLQDHERRLSSVELAVSK